MWQWSPQPARAHSIGTQDGKDKKWKNNDLAQKPKLQVLVAGENEERTFVSVSLYFLAFLFRRAFPRRQPQAPAQEGSLAPEAVPGDGGSATACPRCITPGCRAQGEMIVSAGQRGQVY